MSLNRQQLAAAAAHNRDVRLKGHAGGVVNALGAAAIQAEAGLPVDGRLTPETLAILSDQYIGANPHLVPPQVLRPLPQGLGLYVRGLGHLADVGALHRNRNAAKVLDDPAAACRPMIEAGIRWMVLQVWLTEQGEPWQVEYCDEIAAGWRDAGGEWFGVWGMPTPEKSEVFGATLARAAELCDADLVITNPEKHWFGVSDAEAEQASAQWRRALRDDRRMIMCSYGKPPRRFPLRGFATHHDTGSGQSYDSDNVLGPEYPMESRAAYLAAGYRNYMGAAGTYSKSGDQLGQHLGDYHPDEPIALWDKHGLRHDDIASVKRFVASRVGLAG